MSNVNLNTSRSSICERNQENNGISQGNDSYLRNLSVASPFFGQQKKDKYIEELDLIEIGL